MVQQFSASLKDEQHITSATSMSAVHPDFEEYAGVIVLKPWGYEYMAFCNGEVCVWLLHIRQGFQTSMHCHPNKKTSLIVLDGEARFETLSAQVALSAGQGIDIGKRVFHSTRALSTPGILVMEMETPVHKKDLLRLKDSYGREGQGYEGKGRTVPRERTTHFSFHDVPEGTDGIVRAFGSCELLLKRYRSHDAFLTHASSIEADLVCMLRGGLVDEDGSAVLTVGHTASGVEIQARKGVRPIDASTEVLYVTKRA